jgi:hypothetical protein
MASYPTEVGGGAEQTSFKRGAATRPERDATELQTDPPNGAPPGATRRFAPSRLGLPTGQGLTVSDRIRRRRR